VKLLSDAAVAHLREAIDLPDPGARYTVHELLGRGGMGAVYRATDNTLGRDVAFKVVNTAGDSSGIASRLTREARVLARLEHPGIVAVHDAGTLDDGRPFYVMRLVHGRRLDEYAADAGRGELLRVFLRICDAVSYAHARDVIHRDLTPANVMVGEFGDVLVLDWGVAKVTGEAALPVSASRKTNGTTADGVIVGTPGFMPPEQASGSAAAADARSDVYGLGAILEFILSASAAALPRPIAAIAEKATHVDPGARYQAVESLAADVRRWLDGEPVQAYRERAIERIGRIYRRNQALILLLAAYAIVRVTILLWRGV
jgi:serine/threonine protein kinase